MPSTLCLLQYTPCDSPGMLKRACVPHSGTAHSLTIVTSADALSSQRPAVMLMWFGMALFCEVRSLNKHAFSLAPHARVRRASELIHAEVGQVA